jgi:hypothetical protein
MKFLYYVAAAAASTSHSSAIIRAKGGLRGERNSRQAVGR